MDNPLRKRSADVFPPAIRRENIGLNMIDEIGVWTLPDMGNHRQSSTCVLMECLIL